jgi:hypothetical protein
VRAWPFDERPVAPAQMKIGITEPDQRDLCRPSPRVIDSPFK